MFVSPKHKAGPHLSLLTGPHFSAGFWASYRKWINLLFRQQSEKSVHWIPSCEAFAIFSRTFSGTQNKCFLPCKSCIFLLNSNTIPCIFYFFLYESRIFIYLFNIVFFCCLCVLLFFFTVGYSAETFQPWKLPMTSCFPWILSFFYLENARGLICYYRREWWSWLIFFF